MSALSIARVTAPDAVPHSWMVFLHGILGSGANWRTFARQIVASKPELGALLVDLRLHGDSQGFAPPHTVDAAARDVALALRDVPGRASVVLGHSFGGKVGIALARDLAASPEHGGVEHLFVIDATPGARPDYRGSSGVRHIVELLTELPDELPDRNAFLAWASARGVSRPIAMWLAMNVRPIPHTTRFTFRIDVPSVRAMMEDYFRGDLWAVVEHPEPGRLTHFIAGGKSEVLDDADKARARACPRTTVDVIEGASHWVHVDAPDALRSLVEGYLAGG
jgi:pimeloyl-ACP methyl ester carboxylesterase